MQCYGWNSLCICRHLTSLGELLCIALHCTMNCTNAFKPGGLAKTNKLWVRIAIECVLQLIANVCSQLQKIKLYIIIIMWNPVHWIFHSNAMWNCTASVINYNAIAKNAILDKFGSTYYGSLWVALAPLTQGIPLNSSIFTLLSCSFHSFLSRAVHCQYKG